MASGSQCLTLRRAVSIRGDLLRGDQSVALGGGEVGSDRFQGFAGHAGAVGEVLGGPDPAGCFTDGDSDPVGQDPGHGPFRQHRGHALFGAVLDHGPVHDRELVPDPFQRLQHGDQTERAEIGQGAVVDELDQVLHGHVEGVHRGLQRRCCGLVGGGREHALILLEHVFYNKS